MWQFIYLAVFIVLALSITLFIMTDGIFTNDVQSDVQSVASVDDQVAVFVSDVFTRMSEGGCIGAYKWYTGNGFSDDLTRFEKEYGQKYQANPEPLNASNILPPVALSLKNPVGYDCRSAFMAGLCLAAYYPNVDCVPYFEIRGVEQHIGLRCNETRIVVSNNKTIRMIIPSEL